ncbi:MAG: MFS transporter [Prevotellaceae bacterium]|jgi:acyl-[acyl-carrier-protein]-phospholipid O-acyltransferase/long-chain-fatty-acid--[acyl-carrier-protein] ligase|nr:MFS transporter [Prevotellaceae bacterium]
MKTTKNWTYLFSANFFGILNDNFLKNSIIFFGMVWVMPSWLNLSQLTTLVAAGLVAPYLLLSPLSGKMAVKYSKQAVFRWCKIAEFPIVLLACLAFWKQWILVAVLSVFIMGIQSCLYSPSKYGLIRDIGGEEGVPFGSGVFETMAFLAILVGTVIASFMADYSSDMVVRILFFVFALLGYLFARAIRVRELPVEQEQKSSINPIRFLKQSYRFAAQYPCINIGVFGVSMFWLIGGLLQMNLVIHCKQSLCFSSTATGIIMAIAATGIAAGCVLAGKITNRKKNKRVIFIGLVGMILILMLIILLNPGFYLLATLIFFLALMGGLFEVPCLSMIQQANIGRKLGDMLAYMNFITFVFVLIGTLIFSFVTQLTHENSMAVFASILVLCLFTTVVMYARRSKF